MHPSAGDTITPQEMALRQAQSKFGQKAFTEDHVQFRLIGVPFKNEKKNRMEVRTGTGNTWSEALSRLEAELRNARNGHNG